MGNYSDNRKEHLCNYAKSRNLPVGGLWKGKRSQWSGLILDKKHVVQDYNLLGGISLDLMPVDKLHMYAHHLNSSQILCYNFFRPMLDKNGHPSEELKILVGEKITPITSDASCQFEYDDYERYTTEGTEFDFHIEDTCAEIYFEIKYTEDMFGDVKPIKTEEKFDKRHIEKFNTIYAEMINECTCLKKNVNITKEEFFKNYQLFRNVIRITDKKSFSVFVFPKKHLKLRQSFEEFKDRYISKDYCDNVKALYWEDLVSKETHPDLYEKYFMED